MNGFLDRLAELYAPLGQRGLLMDGQYRFAHDDPDHDTHQEDTTHEPETHARARAA